MGPDRSERLARALTVMHASSLAELRACALVTLISDPGQIATFDQVFAALFGTPPPGVEQPAPQDVAATEQGDPVAEPADQAGVPFPGHAAAEVEPRAANGDQPDDQAPGTHRVASAAERLRGRDFAQLSPAELRELVTLMRELTLACRLGAPAGTAGPDGKRPDLRGTLRPRAEAAARHPVARRAPVRGLAAWSCCAISQARWRRTPARCSC